MTEQPTTELAKDERAAECATEGALGIMRALAGENWCLVSHPDASGPCGELAIGTVWNLRFCRGHQRAFYRRDAVRYDSGHQEALRAAYPPLEGHTDPDTLAFDYEDDCAGTPVDWWWESHWLLCKFMRQTQERGVSELIKMLEPLRERAAAQVVFLAEDDYERRWVAPRRAKREAETAQ